MKRTERLRIRIDESMLADLRHEASAAGVSVSEFVRRVLADAIDQAEGTVVRIRDTVVRWDRRL